MEVARAYFVAQAAAGALWWVAVFASAAVQRWTLGTWSPGWLAGPDLVAFVGGSALAGALGSRFWAAVTATWTSGLTAALTMYGLIERQAGWGVVAMALATVGTLAAALTVWRGRLPVEWFFVGPFAFRVTVDHKRSTHVRRSLMQLLFFWTSFLILVPLLLAGAEQRLRIDWSGLAGSGPAVAGLLVFVLASGFGLWSCLAMALRGEGTPLPAATARKLVVAGPYRIVRNPMAVAGVLQTIGAGLWLGSWMVIASSGAGALIWNAVIRPEEEADLATRFGHEYEAYRARVRCWIPIRHPSDRDS